MHVEAEKLKVSKGYV